VDLERVQREAAQIAQARVAGAEVVDRQAHADRLELSQNVRSLLGIAHQHALGDLQLEQAWIDRALRHDASDRLLEVLLLKLPSGQVHRYRHRWQPKSAPCFELAAGLL